ncbi:MAG: T9SS type A sorting domain-containing protein [Flavobacteriales bacterium]|nr:MAG: T9SS type A sorting domain-containing protein [Flavobacteriales bacterium]
MHRSIAPLALLLAGSLQAQTVQKCCGTSNSTFLLGNLGTANHSQCLYTPGDLTGAIDGGITRIYYRYGTTGETDGNTLTNFMVRMTQTSATAFAGGNTFFTGLDTVLTSASYTIAPGTTGDWFVLELDSTFMFDASLTLVVDLSFTGSLTTNFGTLSTNLAGRKLYWNDITSPTGQSVVNTWQDIGFDLATSNAVEAPAITTSGAPYPNPVRDRLRVPDARTNEPFRVVAADGRVHMEGAWPADGLDLSGATPGMYLLTFNDHSDKRQYRFVLE